MKVIIFGATGMVGQGVLLECLDDTRVENVLLVLAIRSTSATSKVREILHQDFFDFSAIQPQFADRDACFFCLGVSSGRHERARLLPPDLRPTLAAATSIAAVTAKRLTFCYVVVGERDRQQRARPARVGAE